METNAAAAAAAASDKNTEDGNDRKDASNDSRWICSEYPAHWWCTAGSGSRKQGWTREIQAKTNADKNTKDGNDGKDASNDIIEGSGDNGESKDSRVLKDDQENSKYFKMLKMGSPIGAVQNAVQMDDKDPSMDLDPEKSFKSRRTVGTKPTTDLHWETIRVLEVF
jgi:hypothetical protein